MLYSSLVADLIFAACSFGAPGVFRIANEIVARPVQHTASCDREAMSNSVGMVHQLTDRTVCLARQRFLGCAESWSATTSTAVAFDAASPSPNTTLPSFSLMDNGRYRCVAVPLVAFRKRLENERGCTVCK